MKLLLRCSIQDLFTHDQAQHYCQGLELDGNMDWRLPTHLELLDLARDLESEKHETEFQSRDATCWSSTPYHDSLLRYWAVSVFNERSAPLGKDTSNTVICVRDANGL